MSEESDKSSLRVDVGVSAKAEIKGEIPSSSMGRLVDALTDAIRPFTESRGLRADQIRLQREDVLIKIATKARKRLEKAGATPAAIPNKTLVPLLEKASLEDIDDDEMLDRWATLLAAEAGNPAPNRRWMIDILASINSWQARFLDSIARAQPKNTFFKIENYTRDAASRALEDTTIYFQNMDSVKILEMLSNQPGYTLFFDGADLPNTNEFELSDLPEGSELLQLDALGLVWVNATSFMGLKEQHFIMNAQLTPLGFHFTELFIEEPG